MVGEENYKTQAVTSCAVIIEVNAKAGRSSKKGADSGKVFAS